MVEVTFKFQIRLTLFPLILSLKKKRFHLGLVCLKEVKELLSREISHIPKFLLEMHDNLLEITKALQHLKF